MVEECSPSNAKSMAAMLPRKGEDGYNLHSAREVAVVSFDVSSNATSWPLSSGAWMIDPSELMELPCSYIGVQPARSRIRRGRRES